jgi:hypothetical protein
MSNLVAITERSANLLCLPAKARRATEGTELSRSHPSRAFGAVSRRAKIPSPPTPSFLPACWKPPADFSDGRTEGENKKTKEVKTLAPPSRARVFGFLLPISFTIFK